MSEGDLERAHALYRRGRFQEAKAICLQVAASDPANAAALERLGEIALWENQCREAERLFREALRHRPWYLRCWPFDARLKYRVALTHYRRDQLAAAAPWFRRAAGPLALGPFRELSALARQAALFETGSDTAYGVTGPQETTIPFVVTDPLPVIEVFVNGQGPLNFFIDTGAAELIVDREVAGRVGAQRGGSLRGDYAGKKRAETGLGRIGTVTLGDLTMRDVPIHTLDMRAMSQTFNGREIHGALGTRVLMHFLSTLDYVDGTLILRRPERANAQALADSPGATIVPFWLIEMHCIVAWGALNDQAPVLFWVDTGLADAGFMATEEALGRAGIRLDWKKARTGIGGAGQVNEVEFAVDRMALGTGAESVVVTDVRGIAMEGAASVLEGKLGVDVGGLISHQFFRRHALTLDFQGMRLILDRSPKVG